VTSQFWPGVGVTNEVTINADVFRIGAGLVGENQAGSVYLEKRKFYTVQK
jgi:hypothetical protein